MSDLVVLITKAFDFTARKHVGQRRKGADQEPYVNHVAEVARLLAEATNGQDPVLIVAGLLHDTVEDTDTTYEKLKAEFGQEVANLVLEVTDDKSLPKDIRKRLQVETVGKKSDRAKMLKLADQQSVRDHQQPTDRLVLEAADRLLRMGGPGRRGLPQSERCS